MLLRTKLTHAGLVLGLLTIFGALAQAQEPQGPEPAKDGQRMGRGFRPGSDDGFGPGVVRELNLTADQKQQVSSIIRQAFTSNRTVREELRQLREKRLQGTLTSEDEARARTLHEQMRTSMTETKTKIVAVLTPEQKAKLEQLMKDRRAKHEGFGGRRQRLPGRGGQGTTPPQKPAQP